MSKEIRKTDEFPTFDNEDDLSDKERGPYIIAFSSVAVKVAKKLTKQQKKAFFGALQYIEDVYNGKIKGYDFDEFVISGFAGTGKSYLIASICEVMDKLKLFRYTTMSFTGKAVDNLKSKGIEASTMHSLLYVPLIDEETGRHLGFEFKGTGPAYKFAIFDEYSMLKLENINDLKRNNIPVLYFGDFFQLPPIGEDRNYIYERTKFFLYEIRRTAGPTVKFATYLRMNKGLPFKHKNYVDDDGNFFGVCFKDKTKVWFDRLLAYDKIIVGTNKIRALYNKIIRERLGKKSWKPEKGETIMCFKTFKNQDEGTLASNGQEFKIISFYNENHKKDGRNCSGMVLEDQYGDKIFFDHVCLDLFKNPLDENIKESKKDHREFKEVSFFDYCYCVTAHKMQGSEADKILVLGFDMMWAKKEVVHIIYTAITRAKKGAVVVMERKQYLFDKLKYDPSKFKIELPEMEDVA